MDDKGEPPDAYDMNPNGYYLFEKKRMKIQVELADKVKNKIRNMKMEHVDEKTFDVTEVEVDNYLTEIAKECKSFLNIKDETTPIMVNNDGSRLYFGIRNKDGVKYTLSIEKQ